MQTLLIATRNANKTRHFSEALAGHWIVRDLLAHPELDDIEETGATFAENAALKAIAASLHLPGVTTLADDSGLCVDALDGAPGVYSARYAGHPCDDQRNNDLLLRNLAHVPAPLRTAHYHCTIILARDGQILHTAEGRITGYILHAPRGDSGFGYDPLFLPDGQQLTFAELDFPTKLRISHRALALENVLAHLRS